MTLSTLIYFGVKLPSQDDPYQDAIDTAKKLTEFNLDVDPVYSTKFGWYMIIGKRFHFSEQVNSGEFDISEKDIVDLMAQTRKNLLEAGYSNEPRLIIEWQPY